MVYTIPPRNAPNATLGNTLGQSMSQGFLSSAQPAIQQAYQRGQLQQALNKLRMQGQNPNATPTDLLYNLIEASSYSPEIGRNLPALYSELNKAREAAAMKNVNYGGEQVPEKGFQAGGIGRQAPQASPEMQQALQENKFFPSNIGSKEAPGNLPQEATTGQVRPILSGDQLLQKAQQRQAELARNGIIKPFEEVYNQVNNENEQNRIYKQEIENERQKRIESQEIYGQLGENQLKRFISNSTPEEEAIFRKKGEEIAGKGKSQSDIKRYLTKEAEKYKNTLSNIQKNLEAPRIQNKLQRTFLGKGTDIKSVEADAKVAIKPLLDLGLYDRARSELGNAGFYPEERERIIFGEMPKDIKQSIASTPKAVRNKTKLVTGKGGFTGVQNPESEYSLKSRIDLFENISKTWGEGENKKINLLQMRKEYEDRGYDWRAFKDAMNELVNNGYIQLTDDQQNQFNSYLNNPPLNFIESILHGLGLRGR